MHVQVEHALDRFKTDFLKVVSNLLFQIQIFNVNEVGRFAQIKGNGIELVLAGSQGLLIENRVPDFQVADVDRFVVFDVNFVVCSINSGPLDLFLLSMRWFFLKSLWMFLLEPISTFLNSVFLKLLFVISHICDSSRLKESDCLEASLIDFAGVRTDRKLFPGVPECSLPRLRDFALGFPVW